MSRIVQAAPIVHARTAYLDFRSMFLARPDWFEDDDLLWAQKFVKSACRYPEKLRERERWLLVSSEEIRIFGVLAMATTMSKTMTHEIKRNGEVEERGRPLYAFVDLVVRRRGAGNAFDFIPPHDLGIYRTLYEEVVGPRWLEKFSGTWERATPTRERAIDVRPAIICERPIFEVKPRKISIHPQSEEDELWDQVAGSCSPVNLMLGMPDEGYAKRGEFDVASTSAVSQRLLESRCSDTTTNVGANVSPPLDKKK